MRTFKSVFLLIDDLSTDAGSAIYGAFSTFEAANTYLETGIDKDYGEGYDKSNIDIKELTVHGG